MTSAIVYVTTHNLIALTFKCTIRTAYLLNLASRSRDLTTHMTTSDSVERTLGCGYLKENKFGGSEDLSLRLSCFAACPASMKTGPVGS